MNNFFELPQFLCLQNLVGISQKTCECLPDVSTEKTDLIKKSDTGLYIDEHDGSVGCLFLEKAKCFDGDVWDRLILARKEAILQIILDCSVTLDSRYSTIPTYTHNVGERNYSSLLNTQSGVKKINFKTKRLSGAKMRFNSVGFIGKILSGSSMETIRITFTNKTKNKVVSVFDFDVKMVQRTFGIEPDLTQHDMPVVVLDCDGSEYEISYQLDTSKLLPYDNNCTCNCGGVRNTLKTYFDILPDANSYGLMFNVNYFCDENYLLCSLSENFPNIRLMIAEGIRCLTMYKFLNKTKGYAGHGATIENVLNLNAIDETMGAFSEKYNQTLLDIQTKTSSMPNFGCFACNTTRSSRREGIFVEDLYNNAQKNLNEIYQSIYFDHDNYTIQDTITRLYQ